jgi:hypothetical protein
MRELCDLLMVPRTISLQHNVLSVYFVDPSLSRELSKAIRRSVKHLYEKSTRFCSLPNVFTSNVIKNVKIAET